MTWFRVSCREVCEVYLAVGGWVETHGRMNGYRAKVSRSGREESGDEGS